MIHTESPTTVAYRQLTDLARFEGVGDSQLFALAWLAAGRMVAMGKVDGIATISQLTESQAWRALVNAGFPVEAHDLVVTRWSSAVARDVVRRVAAAAVVSELAAELGQHRWDVLPCLTVATDRRSQTEGAIVPELASLLMDMVGAPAGCEVWIPFDLKGQLTIEALRRGWRVQAASPWAAWQLVKQLMLTIETGEPEPATVRTCMERDAAGRPVGRVDFALVLPPFGVHVNDSRMAVWDIAGSRAHEQFSRSESWALFEFAQRVVKRAVFVTPQGVLFAKGQEQRLRECLLGRRAEGSQLHAVIALPPGVFGATAIAGAIVVLGAPDSGSDVYMAELGNSRRSLLEAGDIVAAGRDIALGLVQTEKARLVPHAEIVDNEFSLAPSRYLQRVAALGDQVIKLGEICEAVRPPTTSREAGPFEVAEVGLSDLRKWNPISHAIEKSAYLKSAPRDATLAQPGDVIISIKGSVGRVALMGEAARYRPTVVSQSCLALRLNAALYNQHLSPEVLVMYLRSPHGQAQLAGLQVGAGVQHISPATLLSAVAIPLPSEAVYREIRADYDQLCRLEAKIAGIDGEMADLSRQRWPHERQ